MPVSFFRALVSVKRVSVKEGEMALSRRAFVRTLGIGGAGVLSGRFVVDRGEVRLLAQSSRPYNPDEIVISGNENPRGPGEAALEAIRGRVTHRVGRYPDNVQELSATIARLLGGKPENVLLATGSGSELAAAARAFTGPGRFHVNGSPSYSSTDRTAAEIMKAEVKLVPLTRDLKLDLDAMATAAKGAGFLFICNPNNPTSTIYTAKEIGDLIAKVKAASPNTAIHIDEAYIDYHDLPQLPTAAPYTLQYPDVFLTRTFSKAYGMAGLRLGYAFGQPGTLKKLSDAWGLGSVNALTAAAAIASLNDTAHMEAERRENKRVRDFTLNALKGLGYDAPASHTNFIFPNLRRPAKVFRDACMKEKVFVGRDFPPMEKTHCRISIGTWEEMQKATEVFKRVLAATASSAAE
jgi:histidinol-phosphate aminotransferase